MRIKYDHRCEGADHTRLNSHQQCLMPSLWMCCLWGFLGPALIGLKRTNGCVVLGPLARVSGAGEYGLLLVAIPGLLVWC